MRRWKVTIYTFLTLTIVSSISCVLGWWTLRQSLEDAFLEMQLQAHSQEADRVRALLESLLESGASREHVLASFQHSLTQSTSDSSGFLCLIGSGGTILCHPDSSEVGKDVRQVVVEDTRTRKSSTIGEMMLRVKAWDGLASIGEETQIISQRLVHNTPWMLSIHANRSVLMKRVENLMRTVFYSLIPGILCLVLLGTLSVRFVESRRHREFEKANEELEKRVLERTQALSLSEKKYREFYRRTPAMLWSLNAENRIVEISDYAFAALGYRRKEVVGRAMTDFLPPELATTVKEQELPRFWKEGFVKDVERRILKKDGTCMQVKISAIAEKDDSGRPVTSLAVFTDVSAQRKAEEELKEKEEELRVAQKMEAIGRLAGGVAHDFNNLLTGVFGQCDFLLARFSSDEEARQDLEQIRELAQRAAALTRQLLAFSRKQKLQPETLNLDELVQKTGKMLRRLLGEDIDLVTEISSPLKLVYADPSQLEQVLMNLAINARDAMPGGGRLKISTGLISQEELAQTVPVDWKSSSAAGDFAVVSVEDEGTGMEEEVRQRIFEPFFTTKEPGKGTGLGLSTVYGIVKQHQGQISVSSRPGKGTIFKVYLPVSQSSLKTASTGAREDEVLAGTETILLVEDETVVADLARKALERRGYRVITTNGPEEAEALFKQNPGQIDLLLTDVIMPRLNGPQLYARLARIERNLKVLYMSGYPGLALSESGTLEAGTHLLQKPFDSRRLASKVRAVLDQVKNS